MPASGEQRRKLALLIAWEMYGTPYIWAGDDAVLGFDCSGMIVEILQSTGDLPHGSDYTAEMLYMRFRAQRVDRPGKGRLVFYGTPSKITHIELCLDQWVSLGASGGGSRTRTVQDAIRDNAFVKVRPIRRRNDIVGYADPFKEITDVQV